MNLEPFLCLGGTEIGNGLRTLAYLARGLGGSRWNVHDIAVYGLTPSIEGLYHDIYDDIYEGGEQGQDTDVAYTPGCPCPSLGSRGDFISPAADAAPWYLGARLESGGFLGFIPDVLELTPSGARSVSPRAAFGGVLGPLRLRQRVLQVSGIMVAIDRRGMAWGERWLTEALRGSVCEALRGDVAQVVPACPDSTDQDDIDASYRTLRQVGLVDGPTFAREGDVPACYAQRASFQLVIGNPFLHTPTETLADEESLGDGDETSVVVETAEWLGDAAVNVVIEAVTDLTDVTIRGVPMAEDQFCPQEGTGACVTFTIPAIPAATTLTIDSVDHLVTQVDETSQLETSGFGLLDVTGPFGWIEMPPCSRMCVTVSVGTGDAVVTIERTDREL